MKILLERWSIFVPWRNRLIERASESGAELAEVCGTTRRRHVNDGCYQCAFVQLSYDDLMDYPESDVCYHATIMSSSLKTRS